MSECMKGHPTKPGCCGAHTSFADDKYLNDMMLMPAKSGMCKECAAAHDPEQPHNQQSLAYQYQFYNDNGRWPTWEDAMAHCSSDVKDFWIEQLAIFGIKIERKDG